MPSHELNLDPKPPYSLEYTAGWRTHFRGRYGPDRFENGIYQRVLRLGDRLVLLEVFCPADSDAGLSATLRAADGALSENERDALSDQVNGVLGLDDDLTGFYAMAESDDALRPLVTAFRGLRQTKAPTVFESLTHTILGQQISWQVALSLRMRLVDTYGEPFDSQTTDLRAYPTPERIASLEDADLRALGFSGSKAHNIREIATRISTGDLDLGALGKRPFEEARQALLGLRGIGDWTVSWLGVHALGYSDAMPFTDIALLKALARLLGRDRVLTVDEARAISERWAPYRGYVTQYVFAAMRSGRFPELLR